MVLGQARSPVRLGNTGGTGMSAKNSSRRVLVAGLSAGRHSRRRTGDLSRAKLLPGLSIFQTIVRLHPGLPDLLSSRITSHPPLFDYRSGIAQQFFGAKGMRRRLGCLRRDPGTMFPLAAGAKFSGHGIEMPQVLRMLKPADSLSQRGAQRRPSGVRLLAEADRRARSRVIMDKPFGHDLASANRSMPAATVFTKTDFPHRPFPFLGKEGGAEHPGLPLRQRLFEAI